MLIITGMIVAMLGSALAYQDSVESRPGAVSFGKPTELQMLRGASTNVDLRTLPKTPPQKFERPEREDPEIERTVIQKGINPTPEVITPSVPALNAPAPPPIMNFDGLDFANWGAGHPPDTNGDVGPTYYIQTINTSIGIFRKSDGVRVAAFTFNTFMSQGNFGDVRDTGNFGDPVVLYDTFEDRWVITDFAFTLDGGGNVVNPPGNYQVIAVSKTGDPVIGGWNFYSINTAGGLGDYPKLGIWPDGLYMSVNMFNYNSGGAFQNPRVYAFNKAQMYAGKPTVQVVTFNAPSPDFTVLPSNARLQTGTPPAGTPNYFLSTWEFTNALTIYKFHVDWDRIALSTFTGPDAPLAATSWPNAAVPNAPSQGGNALDVLQIRAMVQNQYTNIGGVESLWATHTVRRGNTTGFAAPRWYQVDVTGGTVNPNLPQAATWDPDGANVIYRFMPGVAVDRAGDMALGYSTSNSATKPALKYAGRLFSDPINTLGQTETLLFQGTGTQTGNCGGTCSRWGDYSAMTLDPDGCTFWYTNQYYAVDGLNHQTRIGSFAFPSCTPVGAGGTLSGTVTATAGGAPLNAVTIQFGARSTTPSGSGFYSFLNIPAGTYPSITASLPGYTTATSTGVVVTDGGTTTKDFSLGTSPTSACLTDTTQADFLTGIQTNLDLNTSLGDVTLSNAPSIDQQNTAGTTTGTGFGTPNWTGQSFIAAITGQLVKADVQVFCNGCGATPPNLTLSVRNTSGGLPTGADLSTATIPGSNFASGATVTYTAIFGAPVALNSGTQYALALRPVSVPAGSGYFWIRSSPSTYANGSRVLTADSGGTWSADTTRDYNFKTYMKTGYAASGDLVSGLKDSNPSPGLTPIWSTLSWNAATPANTTLRFQMAGSNADSGPFNFVGPDGTAATFFTTSPASLNQFYGLRYVGYKTYFATTDVSQTPTLNDVTLCYSDTDCSGSAAVTPTPAQVCSDSTGNTASGPAGAVSYSWSISNGCISSGATSQSVIYMAGTSGSVTLMLDIVEAGGCHKTGSTDVTINPIPATPTITPGGPTTFCAGGSVTLTSSSATGNQWHLNGNPIGGETNQTYGATAPGDYTVIVTMSGCSGSASAATTVTVNPTPSTPTITPGGPTTFCTGGSVTLTSSSATGNQWYLNGNPIGGETNQTYVATASGSYTVTVSALGCASAASPAIVVTVNPIPSTPAITPGGPTTFCAGGSVTLASSSATGNQWYLNGNPIGGATDQNYIATASGNYTLVVTTSGCSSAPSSPTAVTVNPIPATPTATPSGQTTFCAGGSVTLTSSSATGNQWHLNGNPIGGATNQNYGASASGNYTVTVTGLGCTSSASPATTVTVNPIPATPTITPGGPTSFCPGGSVMLTSSSATGNQWYLNGNPIGGAASQQYSATASGAYTVKVTTSGCTSASSPSVTVTVSDTTPPTITCPPNQMVNAASSPAVVTYPAPTVSDNCSGVGTPICSPASGSLFPAGTTTVTCNVNDGNKNSASCQFTVTVSVCTISCPANITTSNSPNLCGAAVTFTPVTTGGACGTVTCTPASGSFFAKGTTTVTCTTAGPSCSFTVTVNDTQPPVFANGCMTGITKAAPAACPFATSLIVTYTTPIATDNCGPAPAVVCNPPSGSVLPLGATTVTCTAVDSSGNTATCSFPVNVYSFCLQDDSSDSNTVFVNALTGDYLFCQNGVPLASGKGTLVSHGCNFQIDHTKGDRKVHVQGDTSAGSGSGSGTAYIQKAGGGFVLQITDRKMTNDACTCSPPPLPPSSSK